MKKSTGVVALFPTMVALALTTNAAAGDVFCPPFIQFETVDNVIVDGLCVIRSSTIEGNVKVESGGNVSVIGTSDDPSIIEGNYESDGANLALAVGTVHIKGDFIIKNTGPGPIGVGGPISSNTVIDGNLIFENNTGIEISARAIIGGNLEVFDNTAGAIIEDNVVDGDLQCEGNATQPDAEVRFAGSGNIVGGNKEGQCAGF